MMEALRVAKERDFRTGDIEVAFTIAEEKGLRGASALDPAVLQSRFGLVFDATDPVVLYTKAPRPITSSGAFTARPPTPRWR